MSNMYLPVLRYFSKRYGIRWLSHTNKNLCANSVKSEGNKSETIDVPESEHQAEITRLIQENVELMTKVVEITDKYQRTLADRENMRNRLDKQIIEAKQFGIQQFCKDLLEVTDVFRKAIESVPIEKVEEGNEDLKNLYNGLSMTEDQLLSVFRRHHLTQISPEIGDKFDTAEQEAMFEVPPPSPEALPGAVAHIMRPGWKLYDRCIRSAQVGIIKQQ